MCISPTVGRNAMFTFRIIFLLHSVSADLVKFMILGVRSLANASRARQFNPLNPPGVGWVPLPQTNMAAVVGHARSCVRGRSCVVVRGGARSVVRGHACVVGHAWSVMRGRSRVVGHAWSCAVGRAWSCAVVRAWSVLRGRAWSCTVGCARSVVRGRAWSCGRAVLPASRPALPCCPLRGQHCRDTNERTNEQHIITP